MTSSDGISGLIWSGWPPSLTTASRIAARSTTQGTPVKSCSTTRAGMKAISVSGSAFGSHLATASMCSLRSEEHTSELQSLMRISYEVFCVKKNNDDRSRHNRRHSRHTLHVREYTESVTID